MKTNKEIITEIIEDLENTVGLTWPIHKLSKITKNKLIECWSDYRDEPDALFYGYTNKSSASRPYKNIFKSITKEYNESWKVFILRMYKYKYCSKCKVLNHIDTFSTQNTYISNLSSICKRCDNLLRKNYYKDHKEKELISRKVYAKNNKEKIARYKSEYNKNNKDKRNCWEAKRRAAKLQRTPSWLTEEDQWMFNEIYSLAKLREELTGIKWHVDHIIPLQGKLVCGLHVPINLQVITATENLVKSNKFNI